MPVTLAQSPDEATHRLHAWLDEQYAEELRFTPEKLTSLGSKALYDRLNDYSLAGEQRRLDWLRQSVASMRETFDRETLGNEGRLSFDFWAYRLQRAEDSLEFSDHRYAFSQINAPHVQLPKLLINDHRVDTESDLQDYIRRLNAIGVALRQSLKRAKTAADRSIRAPRFAYDMVIDQAGRVISGAPFDDSGHDSALWADALGKIDALLQTSVINARAAREYETKARDALLGPFLAGYSDMLAWLQEDRAETAAQAQGAHALPRGEAFYTERLRYYTTTDLSADDIHAIGKAEVKRLQTAMNHVLKRVDFEGSLQEFFGFVRDNPQFYKPDTDAGRQQYIAETKTFLDDVEKRLPDYFGLLPRTDLVVRRVESFRETDGGAAHYVNGTPDGDRPGVYYLHLSDMRSNNLTGLQTTAYHEGNPGHHLQISIAQENQRLPQFRRNTWYSAYGEGWALYAEQVAAEMGLLTNPYNDFGRLTAELFRAIRLVVDTGLHHLGWSEEQAVQYMLENSALSEGKVRSEIRRYIAWPGQATSYKVGMLKILELRQQAQATLGERFDIRGFHDAVLGGGALPLHLLEERVQQWSESVQSTHYRAELIRTSHGVAHITAEDFAGLGYGEGFAAAEDNACEISHSLLGARGEMARYLGAGENNANLIQDAVVLAMEIDSQTRIALDAQTEEDLDWLAGYAAGFNRYLRENKGVSASAWCAGVAWVQPISARDLMARMVLVAQTLPRLAGAIAAAAPPEKAVAGLAGIRVPGRQIAAAWDAVKLSEMGSNAWAFGSERTENGRGLLIGNPHYPWYGASRFWEKHLTIPGRLNVYGAHLLGAPGVAIGFTESVGWSHTVSDSQRLVFYRLQLVPGDPTSYLVDGEPRKMQRRTVAVPVLQDDGTLRSTTHTMYFSHYGPVLSMPGMPWTKTQAFTARDANQGNHFLLAQWKAMNSAGNMDEFIDAHRTWNALPWVNTIAASDDGRAVYLDSSTVGHLSDAAIAHWKEQRESDPLTANLYAERGIVLLDGSDSRNEWQEAHGTRLPGTAPFDARPLLERADYVFNSNDSYWLSNVEHPLTGYSPLYGPTETARSLRTRMNGSILALDSPYDYAGDNGRFNLDEAQHAILANRSFSADLLLADLQSACSRTSEEETTQNTGTDLRSACSAILAFDGHMNEDSAGAVLFREWLAQFEYQETLRAGELFARPFDVSKPLTSPGGLANADTARERLAAAGKILETANRPLDSTLGSTQFARFAGRETPVHGGNRHEGTTNLIISGQPDYPLAPEASGTIEGSSLLTEAGYTVLHGSSFILGLTFDDQGPRAQVLLTYGQSSDPGSPYFDSQTALFRQREWRDALFTQDAIANDTQSRQILKETR
ncbi:MAG: DUF885 family protein [Chromatocurvus sp.]